MADPISDADDGMYCSHRYLTCVADRQRVLPAWLGAFFRTPAAVAQLAAASPGSADRNRTLSMDGLRLVHVPLPPLDVQRRFVERLDAVQARILQRQRAADAVDAELATLLTAAFHRIAAHAPRVRMADIAPLVRRTLTIDPKASYTEIGVRSFFKGTFHRRTISGGEFTWQKLFRIDEGDLIFSNLMAWEKGIAVAGANDDGCVGNTHAHVRRRPQSCGAGLPVVLLHDRRGFRAGSRGVPGQHRSEQDAFGQ